MDDYEARPLEAKEAVGEPVPAGKSQPVPRWVRVDFRLQLNHHQLLRFDGRRELRHYGSQRYRHQGLQLQLRSHYGQVAEFVFHSR